MSAVEAFMIWPRGRRRKLSYSPVAQQSLRPKRRNVIVGEGRSLLRPEMCNIVTASANIGFELCHSQRVPRV